jgi:hypothetical protein
MREGRWCLLLDNNVYNAIIACVMFSVKDIERSDVQ